PAGSSPLPPGLGGVRGFCNIAWHSDRSVLVNHEADQSSKPAGRNRLPTSALTPWSVNRPTKLNGSRVNGTKSAPHNDRSHDWISMGFRGPITHTAAATAASFRASTLNSKIEGKWRIVPRIRVRGVQRPA